MKTVKALIEKTKAAPKLGPKEQALKAQREEKAGEIPDFLKREETPEQAEARRAKQAKAEERKRFGESKGLTVKKPPEPIDPKIARAIARDLKESTDKLKAKEPAPFQPLVDFVAKGQAAQKAVNEIIAKAHETSKLTRKAKKLSPLLARAVALRDNLETQAKIEPKGDTTVKNSAKAKATAKPAPAPKAEKAKKPSKRDIVVDMVCRKEGTTCVEACKKLGWQVLNRSTLLSYCKAAGVKVRTEAGKDDKPDRYFGTRKAA